MHDQVAGMKYDNNAPNSRRPFCEATSLSSQLVPFGTVARDMGINPKLRYLALGKKQGNMAYQLFVLKKGR